MQGALYGGKKYNAQSLACHCVLYGPRTHPVVLLLVVPSVVVVADGVVDCVVGLSPSVLVSSSRVTTSFGEFSPIGIVGAVSE